MSLSGMIYLYIYITYVGCMVIAGTGAARGRW